ncbi:hypothetical protein BU17DRAFT_66383 [Hysterangium stoloniferum]|nr:hypothetical protein BU17DRAFT_66383 [Hysterangium stoloniferum]
MTRSSNSKRGKTRSSFKSTEYINSDNELIKDTEKEMNTQTPIPPLGGKTSQPPTETGTPQLTGVNAPQSLTGTIMPQAHVGIKMPLEQRMPLAQPEQPLLIEQKRSRRDLEEETDVCSVRDLLMENKDQESSQHTSGMKRTPETHSILGINPLKEDKWALDIDFDQSIINTTPELVWLGRKLPESELDFLYDLRPVTVIAHIFGAKKIGGIPGRRPESTILFKKAVKNFMRKKDKELHYNEDEISVKELGNGTREPLWVIVTLPKLPQVDLPMDSQIYMDLASEITATRYIGKRGIWTIEFLPYPWFNSPHIMWLLKNVEDTQSKEAIKASLMANLATIFKDNKNQRVAIESMEIKEPNEREDKEWEVTIQFLSFPETPLLSPVFIPNN